MCESGKITDKTSSDFLKDIIVELEENNQNLNDIKTQIKESSDFLKSDDMTQGDKNIPAQSSEDITNESFNGIFDWFYKCVTTVVNKDNPAKIKIEIPFANRSFELSGWEINRLWVNGNGLSADFLQKWVMRFWYVLVYLYIIKDIHSIIEKIKNGNILTSTDTDVKADML